MLRRPTYEDLQRRIAELEEESAERKRADAELKQSAARYRLIAENSGDVIWTLDLVSHRYTYVSPSAEKFLGYTAEEAMAQPFGMVLTPESLQRVLTMLSVRIAAFEAGDLSQKVGTTEVDQPRKDGSIVHTEVVTTLLTDSQGKVVEVLGVTRDLTERKRAEIALKESEERFRAFFDNSMDAVFLTSPDGDIFSANKAACEMFGRSEEELYRLGRAAVVDPSDPRLVGALEQRSRAGMFKGELTFLRKDGSRFPGEVTSAVFASRDGQPRTSLAIRDITERKRTEAALRESEQTSNRAAEVSRTMAELGRIIGSSLSIDEVYEQFAEVVKRIIPFDRLTIGIIDAKQDTYTYKHAVGISIPERKKGHGIPLPRIMKDVVHKRTGLLLLADDRGFTKEYPSVSFLFKAGIRSIIFAPLISKDEVIGLLFLGCLSSTSYKEGDLKLAEGVARQISGAIANSLLFAERERSEEALRESERRFRYIFNSANDAVFIRDLKGPFWEVNEVACERLGYTREELLRMSPVDIVTPEAVKATREQIRNMEQKGHLLFETVHRRKDGSDLPVEVNSRRIEYDGKPCILSIARDITDRKRVEEEKDRLQAQLLQAQKMESVGRLAGGVAHDFNNMLGIIIGNAEMASLQIPPDEPLHQSLQEIIKASYRSADTVRQLLAFARKQTISPKILDLNDTVSGMLKMLHRLIGENIELTWVPGSNLGKVRMDPSQVNQILANLVVNSRDAIQGVGKVTIESESALFDESYCMEHAGSSPGEYVLLAVSDTGTGMSPEVMEHLFDPFFTTKEVGKGTGLGLATVYGIVKQNNGFITVHSRPGSGTTFKIYFPRHEGESVAIRGKPEADLPRGTETILIAEDEAPLLRIANEILTKQGYKVLAARTPNESLSLSERHTGMIHLLLTDVVMPEMNGRQLAEKLKWKHPDLKCLFMSGYTTNVVAHHGVLDEGVHFVEKPFSPRILAEKVREVLDNSKL